MCFQAALLVLIVLGQFAETLVGELAGDVVLIQPLENIIKFCDPLFSISQQPFLFGKSLVALLQVHINDHLNKPLFVLSCKGNDLPQVVKNQFLHDNGSDGMGLPTHILAFAIPGTDIVFLISAETCCPALIHDRATVGTIHHAGEHPHFSHLCRTAP